MSRLLFLLLTVLFCFTDAKWKTCSSNLADIEDRRIDTYNPTAIGIVQPPLYAILKSVDWTYAWISDITAHNPQSLEEPVPFPANYSNPASFVPAAIGQTRRLVGLTKRAFGSGSLDLASDFTTLRIQTANLSGVLEAAVETALSILDEVGVRPVLTFLKTSSPPISEIVLFANIRGFNTTQAGRIEDKRSCRIPYREIKANSISDISRYAQAIRIWNTIYTSGINGTGATLYAQSLSALSRIRDILNADGEDWQIAALAVFLRGTDLNEEEFYRAYTEFFPSPSRRPVIRMLVRGVQFLNVENLILIEAEAEMCSNCLEFRNSPTVYSNKTLGPQAVITPSGFVITSEVYGTTNVRKETLAVYDKDAFMYSDPPYNKTLILSIFESIAPGFGQFLLNAHESEVPEIVYAYGNLMEVLDMGHATLRDIAFLEVSTPTVTSIFSTYVAQEIAYRGIPIYPPARTDRVEIQLRSAVSTAGVRFSLSAVAAPFRSDNYVSPFSGVSSFPFTPFMCPQGNLNPLCPHSM